MKRVTTAEALRDAVAPARREGNTVGLVPTMGALHDGHASLFRAARAEVGFVVATIFVNPTQFGPNEDLTRYPRPLEKDLSVCERENVDLVFTPDAALMYPPGYFTYVEVHELQDGLCGASRPGHFRGVATIVLKLFNLVQPDIAYFGQKDAQQARIIEQMVEDLDVPTAIRVCPIVREANGLALSSRNQYLDPNQRSHATVLYRSLEAARAQIAAGERDSNRIRNGLVSSIASTPGAVLDYAEIVDAKNLKPVPRIDGEVLIALAVKFGSTRLIDNLHLSVVRGP